MKSEYHQILTWQMHKRITFELINLQNEAESIIESFNSNPRSSSFQRPTNNMNVGFGMSHVYYYRKGSNRRVYH